jgi:hypothetical protein
MLKKAKTKPTKEKYWKLQNETIRIILSKNKKSVTWDYPHTELCNFIDVLMHLTYLGITKGNSVNILNAWLQSKKKSTAVTGFLRNVLKEVRELILSWCKAETHFGGYVSKNWIAYCKISK